MKYLTFLVIYFAFSVSCAKKTDTPWYGGKVNTSELADRAHLYEYYFKNIEESLGVDIRDDVLARKRIVNLVNKAIEDWDKHRKDQYNLEIKYLVLPSEHPLHYDFFYDGRSNA